MTFEVLDRTPGGGTVTAYTETEVETAERLDRASQEADTRVHITAGQLRLLERVQRAAERR